MRLPAVAIAAGFGCGAALGQAELFAQRASSHIFFDGWICFGRSPCLRRELLARIGRLFPAAASLLSWAILGILGAGIARQPRPADYVLSLAEAGRLDLKTPLRWHGHLRDEPVRLPWATDTRLN